MTSNCDTLKSFFSQATHAIGHVIRTLRGSTALPFPEMLLQNRPIGKPKTAPIARSRPSFPVHPTMSVMPPLPWQFAGMPSPRV